MSPAIRFRGKDYPDMEAMPPDIRDAYEKERLQAGDQADDDELDAQDNEAYVNTKGKLVVVEPVAAPIEFDAITNLGPAAVVLMHQGVRLLSKLGIPRPNAIVIYRDGLAYRIDKEPHAWRWEEVTVIQTNMFYVNAHREGCEYTLTNISGEQIILDNNMKGMEDAMDLIELPVFALLAPPLAEAYNSGRALTFGPVTIHKQNGIQLDDKLFAWDTILKFETERGRFTLIGRDSKKHEVRQSAIPNLELLAEFVGLDKFFPTTYY